MYEQGGTSYGRQLNEAISLDQLSECAVLTSPHAPIAYQTVNAKK